MDENLVLQVKNLKKYFAIEEGFLRRVSGYVRAVDNVSFDVHSQETVGLVGESGCGKTTTARVILRALDPTGGEVLFRSSEQGVVDLAQMSQKKLKKIKPLSQVE